ncbi:MAG: acyl-CoA thioesterase [Cytophagales bacterium]|nr:MAG: acyl-CoA thioesterase [Cytophagales bacterium]
MIIEKIAQISYTTMTEMVLPNDTNTLNNLMGGRMLHWIDICGAISAQKHCNRVVVTASVDNVSFQEPIKLGNIVTLEAKVTRAFKSSMEVHIEVFAENIPKGTKNKTHEAFYTYVAIDEKGLPVKEIPALIPETELEQKYYKTALQRRELRLVLAGRMKPSEATELGKIFENKK